MRTFNFKARNIGSEKYLTYTMGAECELDEDVLDYCEENALKELVGIIYEEDDDYDYLTYNITDLISLEEFIKSEMTCEKVLHILRNVASNLISLKEQAIHLSYVLLNKGFMFIDTNNYNISFICLPVESKGSVAVEFKGFVRQLLANMRYDVDEDLNYVGKLLTYINSDNFNLRGLIGLSEALMDEAGISHDEAGAIDADGVEVVDAAEEPETKTEENNVADFMNSLNNQNEPLPEIGDDDEEQEEEEEEISADEELDSILPAGMKVQEEPEADGEKETEEPEIAAETVVETPETTAKETETAAKAPKTTKKAAAAETKEMPSEEPVEAVSEVQPEKKEDKPEMQSAPAETQSESAESEQETPAQNKGQQKETDIDLIKDRIKKLVGDTPASNNSGEPHTINSLEELDEFLESKPPVVKKNVVKVNRAAIIQNVAAEHENEEAAAAAAAEQADSTEIPVIEDIYEDMNVEKEEKEKPKSRSILSKTVAETPKTNTLLNAPKAVPYLIRVNTEERIMLNKPIFKIGKASRGVDYTVSGNGAISRQHAVIVQKDGVCFIKDNKSTNHTYVNGKAIEDGVEEILTHDSMIKLGDEEFIFKIR